MPIETFQLVWPTAELLPEYIHALQQGWSPDVLRPEVAQEHLQLIAEDPNLFLSHQIDREARGPRVVLPDSSTAPRLSAVVRWMWDGEYCGTIGLRWQAGTEELPPYCLGHIGYSVVPWKRRRGYATQALGMFLPEVRNEGLTQVEIVTGVANVGSQRVIEANGGKFVEQFLSEIYPDRERIRYRIALTQPASDNSAIKALAS
jgi:predicted acetyltransferase